MVEINCFEIDVTCKNVNGALRLKILEILQFKCRLRAETSIHSKGRSQRIEGFVEIVKLVRIKSKAFLVKVLDIYNDKRIQL